LPLPARVQATTFWRAWRAGFAATAPVAISLVAISLATIVPAAAATTSWHALMAPARSASAQARSPAGAPLPSRTLSIGTASAVVEVVDTPDARATGLMNRFSLQQDHGMLFVFDRAQPLGFWMKNTYIPLSIAFVDSEGRILNIEDMQPRDESVHMSRAPALYAIEMRRGWFAAKGITAGDRVKGLPGASRQ
jgi:uncharacterized membrane protein (UPF0127 family)